jgi:hypothetical protein
MTRVPRVKRDPWHNLKVEIDYWSPILFKGVWFLGLGLIALLFVLVGTGHFG